MRYITLLFVVFFSPFVSAQGQTDNPLENVVVTSGKNVTEVRRSKKGKLLINVSKKDIGRFKSKGLVRYSDFGAKGDGKTDDMDAIIATHAFANQHGLPVQGDAGATYYIDGKDRTAVIRTNTDFGTAAFVIDDRDVKNRSTHVFLINSNLHPFRPEGVTSLKRNQRKVEVSLPGPCLVTVTDSNVRRYIRFGPIFRSAHRKINKFVRYFNRNIVNKQFRCMNEKMKWWPGRFFPIK